MVINNWESESMDWLNPEPTEAKYWEAMRKATFERVIHRFEAYVPSFLEPIMMPLFDDKAFDISANRSWISILEERINRNFLDEDGYQAYVDQWHRKSGYMNHQIRGGNWNGVDHVPLSYSTNDTFPLWTMESALTAIGDTERIIFYDGMISDAKTWLIQSRKLLNLLRWFRNCAYNNAQGYNRFKVYSVDTDGNTAYQENGTSMAEAESKFNQDQTNWFGNSGNNTFLWHIHNTLYAKRIYASPFLNFYSYGASASIDPYMVIIQDGFTMHHTPPIEGGVGNEKWTKLTEMSESNQHNYVPVLPNSSFFGYSNSDLGMVYTGHHGHYAIDVLKFDGPNGFKFKDW